MTADVIETQWFVVESNPQCEVRAEQSMLKAGYAVYLPRRKVQKTHKRTNKPIVRVFPLMRGYLFVEQPYAADWFTLRRCDGVKQVLGSREAPIAIPASVVSTMRTDEENLAFDDTDEAKIFRGEMERNAKLELLRRFPQGVPVEAVGGLFEGRLGTVDTVTANGHVRVLLDILGGMTPVEFPSEELQRLDAQSEAA